MKQNNFRYDINGLRAYAVMLVVLFHFNVTGFESGFVGVDIFFVISGFLMTKIILEKTSANQFSILNFLLARSIRILPALLLVTVAVSLLGWVILNPEDYKKYGFYALSSVAFLSNIYYWKKSGDYFSTDSHDIPLLHTWSLSVEWQFYLLFPIFILILTKIKNDLRLVRIATSLILPISFCISIILQKEHQTFNFYMLPSRAWEMLAGSLVYLYGKDTYKNKKIIGAAGLILITICFFTIKKETLWPGYLTIIPVIGSMLIIAARNKTSVFLKTKPVQLIGNCSYSIYLWHWPIVFFLTSFEIINVYTKLLGIITSLGLGYLSYRFVEVPTRKSLASMSKVVSTSILGTVVASCSIFYAGIIINQGMIERSSDTYLSKTAEIKMPRSGDNWCFYDFNDDPKLQIGKDAQHCFMGETSASSLKNAVLFGDSFAGHNAPFWDVIGKDLHLKIQGITTNWCYPSINDDFTGNKTSKAYQQCLLNRDFLIKNADKYEYIIIAGMWSDLEAQGQLTNLRDFINSDTFKNKKIIIMDEPYAFDKKVGEIYKRKTWLNQNFNIERYLESSKSIKQNTVSEYINTITESNKKIFFIRRSDLFTPNQASHDGVPYSTDGLHLSVYGSKSSAAFFMGRERYEELEGFLSSSN